MFSSVPYLNVILRLPVVSTKAYSAEEFHPKNMHSNLTPGPYSKAPPHRRQSRQPGKETPRLGISPRALITLPDLPSSFYLNTTLFDKIFNTALKYLYIHDPVLCLKGRGY